jgi:hypothetical protein
MPWLTLDTVEYGTDDDGKDEANLKVSSHAAVEEENIDTEVISRTGNRYCINARNASNETLLQ